MKTSNGILMIEPSGNTGGPLIDELTRKMTAAWHCCRDSTEGYRGFHVCACGACSDNKDHWVGDGDGLLTNSLSIHYLAFHRDDIPQGELDKVRALPYGEEEPNEKELSTPTGTWIPRMRTGPTSEPFHLRATGTVVKSPDSGRDDGAGTSSS